MNNSCNISNAKPIKVSELASYSSLNSNDFIQIIENNSPNLYSRKSTFSDFVKSITSLTASLSGNIKGEFTGNLIGNVTGNLTGNIKGKFKGKLTNITGSIKGVNFKSLNDYPLSFDGTTSYSVSSSLSLTSSYAQKTLSSSYALTSSYSFTNYSINSISSSYSLSSSLSFKSLISSKSLVSQKSNNAITGSFTKEALKVKSSSYSDYSEYSRSSSYALLSKNSKTSSFSNTSLSGSFSQTSSYTLVGPPAIFEMVYTSTFDEQTNGLSLASEIYDGGGSTFKWRKIILSKSFDCGVSDTGKIPPNVKYIYLTFRFNSGNEFRGSPYMVYSPDPYDVREPQIVIDHVNVYATPGEIESHAYIKHAILPIKTGLTGSFYYKIRQSVEPDNAGEGYFSHNINLLGYVKPYTCP